MDLCESGVSLVYRELQESQGYTAKTMILHHEQTKNKILGLLQSYL